MAYTINKTDGSILATVADGTINTDYVPTLIGKNYAGYGDALNESFVHMLENSANTTAPINPIAGQLWYNTTNGVLEVYDSVNWKTLASSTVDTVAPSSAVTGDMWFDDTNKQLNVYDGAGFVLVGPGYAAGVVTGAIVEDIQDNTLAWHTVTMLYVEDEVVGVISKDASFTPNTAITGAGGTVFPATVEPGITLAISISGQTTEFVGNATNALSLGGQVAANYLRSDTADSTSGILTIANDGGLVFGATSQAELKMDTANDVALENTVTNGDIIIRVDDGGVPTDVITVDGATGRARVSDPLGANDVANQNYVDTEIASHTHEGNTIDATAVTIDYILTADGAGNAAWTAPPTAAETKDLYENLTVEAANTSAIDFASSITLNIPLTGNVSLTSSNLAAGRRVDVFFDADASARTVTLNASWASFGEVSPIVIPANKSLILTLTSTTAAETGVYCAAVLEN